MVSLLTEQENLRDVVLFPTMKSQGESRSERESSGGEKKQEETKT
jgi:aspartyl-tRNA synthetase